MTVRWKPIEAKDLPLNPEDLKQTTDYCKEEKARGRLRVLGGIPDELRMDYLDTSLDPTLRATSNINISSTDWRQLMMDSCFTILDRITGIDFEKAILLPPWRSALAFAYPALNKGTKRFAHCGIERMERDGKMMTREYLPIDKTVLDKPYESLIVADPMNATGTSIITTLEKLINLGVPEEKIIVTCVVSAPEGCYNILNRFLGVKIITAALDSHLNEKKYIQPGLGDAGDKFFDGLEIDFFKPIRHIFTNAQWAELQHRINLAQAKNS